MEGQEKINCQSQWPDMNQEARGGQRAQRQHRRERSGQEGQEGCVCMSSETIVWKPGCEAQ